MMKRFYAAILGIVLGAFLGFFFSIYPISGFMLSQDQKQLIQKIDSKLNRSEDTISFRELSDFTDWDSVCIILPYAYGKYYSPYTEIQKYFGKDYNRWRIFVPDTSNNIHGIGFAFLKNSHLQEYIEIPKHVFSISITSGITVKRVGFKIDNKMINLGDVTYQIHNGERCFLKGAVNISIDSTRKFVIE